MTEIEKSLAVKQIIYDVAVLGYGLHVRLDATPPGPWTVYVQKDWRISEVRGPTLYDALRELLATLKATEATSRGRR